MSKTTRTLTSILAITLIAGQSIADPSHTALPQGPSINQGAGTFQTTGSSLTIAQATSVLDTNWSSFDIGSDASVSIVQPSSTSTFIGRVQSGQASAINGALSANGRVVLTNPYGIVFAGGSRVDVGGLVAAAGRLQSYDANAGQFSFDQLDGSVTQDGVIRGDFVALVGGAIEQRGTITSTKGDVALAAGDTVSMNIGESGLLSLEVASDNALGTIEQSGEIVAEGTAILKADAAQDLLFEAVNGEAETQLVMRDGKLQLVEVGGTIAAKSIEVDAGDQGAVVVEGQLASVDGEQGGRIDVLGGAVIVANGATLDASGASGGGLIQFGGSWQNSDLTVPQSLVSRVEQGASLLANATVAGDGGEIVVWSDIYDTNSVTDVSGRLSTKGKGSDGRGGRIETSGFSLGITNVEVVTSSDVRGSGIWLIDPYNYTIRADQARAIESALASSNVEITTTSNSNQPFPTDGVNAPAAGDGDIRVVDTINSTATAGNYLLFNADNDIQFDYPITMASGDLILNASNDILFSRNYADTGIFLNDNATLTLRAGGDIGDQATSYTGVTQSVSPESRYFGLTDIHANAVRIVGTAGTTDVELGNLSSDINVLAVEGVMDLSFGNSGTYTIGSVTTSADNTAFPEVGGTTEGISAAGQITLRTHTGDINVTKPIETTRVGFASLSLITAAACNSLDCPSDDNIEVALEGGEILVSGDGDLIVPENTATAHPETLLFTKDNAAGSSLSTYLASKGITPQLRAGTNNALLDGTPGGLSDRDDLDQSGTALLMRHSPIITLRVTDGADNEIVYTNMGNSHTGLPFDPDGNYVHYLSGNWDDADNTSREAQSLPGSYQFAYASDDGTVVVSDADKDAIATFANAYSPSYTMCCTFYADMSQNTNGGDAGGRAGMPSSRQPIPGYDYKIYSVRDFSTDLGFENRVVTSNGYTIVYNNDSTFSVTPKPITPVIIVNDKVYDGTTSAPTRSILGLNFETDFHYADSISYAGVYEFEDKNVAYDSSGEVAEKLVNVDITLSGSAADYYTIVPTTSSAKITPAPLTQTSSKVYDGTSEMLASDVTFSGLIGSESLSVTGTATANSANVLDANTFSDSSNLVIADGIDTLFSNYEVTSEVVEITPKAVAFDVDRVYNGRRDLDTSAITIETGISGEDITYTVSSDKPYLNSSNVTLATELVSFGTLQLADGTTGIASNYTLPNLSDVTVNLTPYQVGVSSSVSKVYDGTIDAPGTLNTAFTSGGLPGDSNMSVSYEYDAGTFNDPNVASATTFTYTGGRITDVTTSTSTSAGVIDDAPLITDFTVPATVAVTGTITPYTITGSNMSFAVSGHPSLATIAADDATISDLFGSALTFETATGVTLSAHSSNTAFYIDNHKLSGAQIFADGSLTSNFEFETSTSNADRDEYTVTGTQQSLRIIANPNSATFSKEYDGTSDVTVFDIYRNELSVDSLENVDWLVQNVDTGEIYEEAWVDSTGAIRATGNVSLNGYAGVIFDSSFDNSNVGDTTVAVENIRVGANIQGDRKTLFETYYSFVDSQIPATITPRFLDVSLVTSTDTIEKYYDGTNNLSPEVSLTFSNPSQIIGSEDVSLVSGQAIPAFDGDGAPIINATAFSQMVIPEGTQFALTGNQSGNYVARINVYSRYHFLKIHPQILTLSATRAANGSAEISVSDVSITGAVVGENLTLEAVNVDGGAARAALMLSVNGENVVPDPNDRTQVDYFLANTSFDEAFIVDALSSYRAEYDAIVDGPIEFPFVSDATTEGTHQLYIKPSGRNLAATLISSDNSADLANYCIADCAQLGGGFAGGGDETVSGIDVKTLAASGIATFTAPLSTPLSLSGFSLGEKVYDGTTAGSLSLVSDWGTLTGTFAGTDANTVTLVTSNATLTYATKNVGSSISVTVDNLSLTGTNSADYSVSSFTTTGVVMPKPITISGITASNRAYDGTTSATIDTSSALGWISGDTVSVAAAGAFASANADDGILVALNSTYSGADVGNYTITDQTSTSANITPVALQVVAVLDDKTYDASISTTVTQNSVLGLVGSEDLLIEIGADLQSSNAGTHSGVLSSAVVNDGVTGLASNYTLATSDISFAVGGDTAVIAAKSLTATATAADKVYDRTTDAQVSFVLGGLVGSEDLGTPVYSASFASANVGSQAVTLDSIQLTNGSTGLSANYALAAGDVTFAQSSAQITARPLTFSGTASVQNKVYDGTVSATADLTNLSFNGQLSGDSLGTAVATFVDANAGDDKVVQVSFNGGQGSNYSVPSLDGVTGTIAPKSLTATGIVQARDYDGTDTANVQITLSGLVAGQTLGDTVVGASFDSVNVGSQGVTLNTITLINEGNILASNYDLAASDVTLDLSGAVISPYEITISGITAASKPFDGNDTATIDTSAATGWIAEDDFSVVATGRFEDAEIGTDKRVDLISTYAGNALSNYIITDQQATVASILAPQTPRPDNVQDVSNAVQEALNQTPNGVLAPQTANVTGSFENGPSEKTGTASQDDPILDVESFLPQRRDAINRAFLSYDVPMIITVSEVSALTQAFNPDQQATTEEDEFSLPISDILGVSAVPPQFQVILAIPGSGDSPDWVSFDRETQAIVGKLPEGGDLVTMLRIGVSDPDGNFAAVSLALRANAADQLAGQPQGGVRTGQDVVGAPGFLSIKALRPLEVAVGESFVFEVDEATFVHENSGEPLQYTATLADGGPLPSWTSFDAASLTFTGQAPVGVQGQLDVIVKAIDSASQEAQVQMRIDVAN